MAVQNNDELFIKYINKPTIENRNNIINEYAPLVKIVASRLSKRLGSSVDTEELEEFGIFGLIDAIDKYKLSMNIKFKTYASIRIRGEIIDQIRRLDYAPRSVRQLQKKLKNSEDELESRLGRKPTDAEMMEDLGINKYKYYEAQTKIISAKLVYMDKTINVDSTGEKVTLGSTLIQDTFDVPEQSLNKKELSKSLKKALNKLAENERKVIIMLYYEGLTMTKISKVLNITVGRVSQLHYLALRKLRHEIGDYLDLFYQTY